MSRAGLQHAPQSARQSAVAATSLRIGPAHDAYEREADEAAEKVATGESRRVAWSLSRVGLGPVQRECSCGGTCDDCKRKKETLQRHASSPAAATGSAPASVSQVLSRPGNPLDGGTRSFMESRFGYDFGRVRIHDDGPAASSAREVSANAYTVGSSIVFNQGKYQPHSPSGRRLLAHELAHVVQQSSTVRFASERSEIGDIHGPHEADAEAAAASIHAGRFVTSFQRGSRLNRPRLQREPGSQPPVPGPVSATDDFSAIVSRLEQLIRTGPVPNETRVIAAVIVDVPGYPGPREIRTISGAATDPLGQGASVHHAPSPAAGSRTLSATRSIAGAGSRREFPFSHINDAEIKAFEEIARLMPENAKGSVHFLTMRVRQVAGKTVFEPIPACSGCTRATFEMGSLRGVNMISHAATHPTGTLDLSDEPGVGSGAKGATEEATHGKGPAGESPKTGSVQVGTKIEVTSSTTNPDGSTISEVEYNFTENLEQLNHGAPAAGKIPSRIVVRVTQNAEGAIVSVESLSGQPPGLVEALARRTLTPGALASETRGAAEGAAAAAGPSLLLTRGLKFGGWAAFAVITGYQLLKATPEQRPRVGAEAAGGFAGGALSTYLVCNAALDIETAGWGLLICGFIAGGVGGAWGSKVVGAAYGDEGGNEMESALHRLDAKNANEKTLFNLLVGRMGDSSGCIDADFVNGFMAEVPPKLEDSEVVLIASQLTTLPVVPAAQGPLPSVDPAASAQKSHQGSGSANVLPPGPKGTECPGCHGRSMGSLQPGIPPMDKKSLEAIAAAPTGRAVRSSALQALRTATAKLPRFYHAPGDIAHHVDPDVWTTPKRASAGPNAFPSEQEQRGNCPGGNCHTPNRDEPMRLPIDMKATSTKADRRAIAAWIQQPPQTPPPAGNVHATPPGTPLPPAASQDIPSLAEQQGTGCPSGNCHSSPTDKGPLGTIGGFGTGSNGQLTDADRQRLMEFLNAQK